MGDFHNGVLRFTGRDTRADEEEGGATSTTLSPRQSQSDHSVILRFSSLAYYKARKGLFRSIISILRRSTSEIQILPIRDPRAARITKCGNDYHHAFLDSCFHKCDEDIADEEGHTSYQDKIIPVPESIRWIKHYSNRHRILLVGDGDFSFSASLAFAFGRASNMIATSLDSKAFLVKNYGNAHFNITELRNRGCKVMHGIDATKVAEHSVLGHLKFDRIIYNFPFAGYFKNMPRETQLKRHRRLVSLFLKNAREMISEDGEIHISHKTNGFHGEWKLVSVASSHRLRLVEATEFTHLDYPGYNTKCGFGGDTNFNCKPSKTYKFGFKSLCY